MVNVITMTTDDNDCDDYKGDYDDNNDNNNNNNYYYYYYYQLLDYY